MFAWRLQDKNTFYFDELESLGVVETQRLVSSTSNNCLETETKSRVELNRTSIDRFRHEVNF